MGRKTMVVILLFIVMFGAGCERPTGIIVEGGNSYPDEAVKYFKRGCALKGIREDECDCQIKKMQSMVPYEEYKQMKKPSVEVAVEMAKCSEDQHHYPVWVVESIISHCVKMENHFYPYHCACMVEHMQRLYPFADYVRYNTEGRIDEVIRDSKVGCGMD